MGKYLDETGTQFLVDKIKEGSAGGVAFAPEGMLYEPNYTSTGWEEESFGHYVLPISFSKTSAFATRCWSWQQWSEYDLTTLLTLETAGSITYPAFVPLYSISGDPYIGWEGRNTPLMIAIDVRIRLQLTEGAVCQLEDGSSLMSAWDNGGMASAGTGVWFTATGQDQTVQFHQTKMVQPGGSGDGLLPYLSTQSSNTVTGKIYRYGTTMNITILSPLYTKQQTT